MIAITGARLIDGTGSDPVEGATVLVNDRRIEDVMTFEKTKARFRTATERIPSPLNVLNGLMNMVRTP